LLDDNTSINDIRDALNKPSEEIIEDIQHTEEKDMQNAEFDLKQAEESQVNDHEEDENVDVGRDLAEILPKDDESSDFSDKKNI